MTTLLRIPHTVNLHNSARIKYKLMDVMVLFLTCEKQTPINVILDMHVNKAKLLISETSTGNHGVNIYSYRIIKHNDQCTYLNSGLLLAPREYVLHGLALSMY
jgi:hypothetical protein